MHHWFLDVFRVKVVLRGLHLVCSFESIGSFGWLVARDLSTSQCWKMEPKKNKVPLTKENKACLVWMSEVGNFWNPPLAASETCSDHSNQGTCVSMPLGAKDWINAVETRGREFGGSYPMHLASTVQSHWNLFCLCLACFTLPETAPGVSLEMPLHGSNAYQTQPLASAEPSATNLVRMARALHKHLWRDAGRSLSSFFMSIRPVSRSQPVDIQ